MWSQIFLEFLVKFPKRKHLGNGKEDNVSMHSKGHNLGRLIFNEGKEALFLSGIELPFITRDHSLSCSPPWSILHCIVLSLRWPSQLLDPGAEYLNSHYGVDQAFHCPVPFPPNSVVMAFVILCFLGLTPFSHDFRI